MKIYQIQPSNDFAMPGPTFPEGRNQLNGLNRGSVATSWTDLSCGFYTEEKSAIPDITLLLGQLCFRADICKEIFPHALEHSEFLPVTIDGVDWLILNCFAAAKGIDLSRSIYFASSPENGGEIFLISRLALASNPVDVPEIFVVDGSTRAFLYVKPEFHDRVLSKKLNGIRFKHIGEFT